MQTTLVRLTDPRIGAVALGHEIWTSLEGENPGGSIKDRMVVGELEQALESGRLRPGDTVAEISAGSTALSIAFHSRRLGLKCLLFVPKDLSPESRTKLEELGAELHFADPATAYKEYDEFCATRSVWRFDQMKRPELRNHYASWAGTEIAPIIGPIDFVIAAVGTGHSLFGVQYGLTPRRGTISAEPAEAGLIHGIRNLEKENFGAADPCKITQIDKRIELTQDKFFPTAPIETDHGPITVSDSFRVVLGALDRLDSTATKLSLFAVGSHNRRLDAKAE